MPSARSRTSDRGTSATRRLGSAAAKSGLASVFDSFQSQFSNHSRGSFISSRSQTSTCGRPRSRGNRIASGPSRRQTTFMASHARRESKCEPAHRSEVVRAAAMKLCTGPMERASNAASPLGSAAKAPAKAEVRSRWSQMEWSGTRVSAGSSGQSAPSLPSSSSFASSGPKRQKASCVRSQSTESPDLTISLVKCLKLRCLMPPVSVSPSFFRSNTRPVSGWTRTGSLDQSTCAQPATTPVFPSPVGSATSSSGHCGLSAAEAHQSARFTCLYIVTGMPFSKRTRSRTSSLSQAESVLRRQNVEAEVPVQRPRCSAFVASRIAQQYECLLRGIVQAGVELGLPERVVGHAGHPDTRSRSMVLEPPELSRN